MAAIHLGIDLGNVIIDHVSFGTTREYVLSGDYQAIPPVPGAVDALITLIANESVMRCMIIYNATDVVEEKVASWVARWVPPTVRSSDKFACQRSLSGRDKALDCLRFGLTHFVDDRMEVMKRLRGRVPHLFLFRPNDDEKREHYGGEDFFVEADGWPEVLRVLLPTESDG